MFPLGHHRRRLLSEDSRRRGLEAPLVAGERAWRRSLESGVYIHQQPCNANMCVLGLHQNRSSCLLVAGKLLTFGLYAAAIKEHRGMGAESLLDTHI
uniref:Uncharacterized protein n=1 Tax=Pyxicephalus adspersus TaxID=30357 RepID=A0AAV2ZXK6_PYXAD|nr:TPA: hypothetical protein GDO54_014211 [Pyxicephalus adspersus]